MFRERNHTKRGGWGENGKVNEAKYQQLVNLGKEYVLGSSLDIFATFLHIWNLLKIKRVLKNCLGFAQSNANDILSLPYILWNPHCTSLAPLSKGVSLSLSLSLSFSPPRSFPLPLICTRCALSPGPVFCGTFILSHVIFLSLASWIASELRFNLKNSHIEQKYGFYEVSCMLQLSVAPKCCGSGLFLF